MVVGRTIPVVGCLLVLDCRLVVHVGGVVVITTLPTTTSMFPLLHRASSPFGHVVNVGEGMVVVAAEEESTTALCSFHTFKEDDVV